MDKAVIDQYNENSELKRILSSFEQKYLHYYRAIKANGKTKLIKYSAVFFKKWYYSTLVNQTNLSPGIMFDSQINSNRLGLVVIPTIKPVMSGKILKGFDITLLEFSADNHPILHDLKILIESCLPDSTLEDEFNLPQQHKDMLMLKLSQYNPCYVDYLMALAYKLNLLKNLTSIHSYRVQAVSEWEDFFSQSPRDQLNDIIDAAIKLCSANINSILPKEINIFNEGFIKDLLKSPRSLDDMFIKVFASLGLDIESLADIGDHIFTSDMPFDENESALLMSSTFFLGILIDQWFLTPFGQYLQLIQPLYLYEFLFKSELNFLLEDICAMEDVNTSLYSPSTLYTISNLGRKIFKGSKYNKNGDIKKIKSQLPFKELAESVIVVINSPQYILNQENDKGNYFTEKDAPIFQLKLLQTSPKKSSKTIEIESYETLHFTHKYISELYKLDSQIDYVFQADKVASPFSCYTSPQHKSKTKKADTITLEEIFDGGRSKIYYSNDYISITLEFSTIVDVDNTKAYPRTVSNSRRRTRL